MVVSQCRDSHNYYNLWSGEFTMVLLGKSSRTNHIHDCGVSAIMEEELHKLQVSIFHCKEEWCPACRLEGGGGGGGGVDDLSHSM